MLIGASFWLCILRGILVVDSVDMINRIGARESVLVIE